MKKARQINSAGVVATLCLAAALTALAQDAPIAAPGNPPQRPPMENTGAPDQPMIMMNKCSKLVGATVCNPQGDVLGKIDDVIVDFNSGRVAYCALKVKEGVLMKPTYLALPLAAFQPSPDGMRLILNADKNTVAQAKGFDRNNWPPLNTPAWGAQPFWQTDSKTAPLPPDHNTDTGPATSR